MADKKKKIEELDEEKDIDELEEELESSEEDDSEDDGSEDNKKKEDKEESSEDEESEEDSDSPEEEEKEVDEDREAIRERRRREKKMKRERERREKALLQQTIITMANEIKTLKNGQGEVTKRFEGLTNHQIDSEISELGKVYQQAQEVMKAAIADGDGDKFVQAKAISDKAWARYTLLETQKRQRSVTTTTDDKRTDSRSDSRADQDDAQDDASDQVVLGTQGKRFGVAFVNKHKSWYDPSGGNRDSKIVQTIDTDLYKEGYDPESKEYWDELEDRCKDYLPHRFKGAMKKPKSTVGGSGRDNSSSTTPEKSLPKEFVQTLKVAGYWEDPVKRKAAIKDFYAQRKAKGA